MTKKLLLTIILVVAISGAGFSGYLSYRELFCGCTFCLTPGAPGTVWGYPACLYGFFMYLILVVLAILGLRAKK